MLIQKIVKPSDSQSKILLFPKWKKLVVLIFGEGEEKQSNGTSVSIHDKNELGPPSIPLCAIF